MQNKSLKQDEFFMKQALRLAKKGYGKTYPNPMVGAVIVENDKIIAKGYHKKAGLAHAEIEAMRNAKRDVKGTTLYVTLEPCSHFGKTPPCTDAVIASGINRVVCALQDPNPLVNGKGIAKLRKAGVEVSVGILANDAKKLNEEFFEQFENKRSHEKE